MNQLQICRCEPAEYQAALKCLHDGLSPDQQIALVQTLSLLGGGDESLFDGLFVAKTDDRVIAAAWVQFTPGNAAVAWPPAFESPAAKDLMLAIDHLLEQRQTSLAQILIAATEVIDEELLKVARFRRLVDLAYYTLEHASFPNYLDCGVLEFVPHANNQEEVLKALVQESYVDTLDCPELNDLRDPADVVAGYQAQGTFDPNNWYLVRHNGRDVGVLILAEHPPGENWELVYMGIVPAERGHGFGEQVVRFAIEQAQLHNAQRLVLAVDERNSPALEVYRRIGFVLWDRRTVYARLRKDRNLRS